MANRKEYISPTSPQAEHIDTAIEAIIDAAHACLRYPLIFMSPEDRAFLLDSLAKFRGLPDVVLFCQALQEKFELSEGDINKIVECVINPECKMRLVNRICDYDEFMDRETCLVFAVGYISFLTVFLDEEQKYELAFNLAHYNSYFTSFSPSILSLLETKNILAEDHIRLVMGCLNNQEARSELIRRISEKEIL